jgi:BirA family biotin operon repressor/biotin-[acetyl-CoA-carboxylase] ligase
VKRGETRAAVLRALTEAGPAGLSGAALAEALAISRTSIWKQVRALRDEGYAIAGRPGGGYAIEGAAPKALAGLATARLTYHLHHRERVGSTNDWAKALAAAGAPEGTLCAAEAQTAGRGRRGRTWLSPAGGIYLSLILRPPLPPAAIPRITLMAAVAVARAIGPEAEIKWPNDVLVGGRKVCGILCELRAEDDLVDAVILGIGINAQDRPELQAVPTAAALRTADRAGLLRAVLAQLDACYETLLAGGWPDLLAEWRRRSCTLGRAVTVSGAFGEASGLAADVDGDGALLLQTAAGVRRFLAGEVTLAGTAAR